MLERLLATLEKSVDQLRTALENYLKVISNLNNKDWEADAKKAKDKVSIELSQTTFFLLGLGREMKKLSSRKEIMDKLKQITGLQERASLLVQNAEAIINDELVKKA